MNNVEVICKALHQLVKLLTHKAEQLPHHQ